MSIEEFSGSEGIADLDAVDLNLDGGESEPDADTGAHRQADHGAKPGSGELKGGSGELRGYNARDVNDRIFEELKLSPDVVREVQTVWSIFLSTAESREAAGEAIYSALFDAAPSIQGLFKTPRAVMAMRFMNGVSSIISTLGDPKGLKVTVETLGFQHLDLEVTVPRVIIFRDAIVDLLATELGVRFNAKAREGFSTFLNYTGGSYIYVRTTYAERLRVIAVSWASATKKAAPKDLEGEEMEDGQGSGEAAPMPNAIAAAAEPKSKKSSSGGSWFGKAAAGAGGSGSDRENQSNGSFGKGGQGLLNRGVPTTYNEMFRFNAAVMGFGSHSWLNEVLASFDAIVVNAANSYRLQEECDVLSLRMAKYKGSIALGEYKAVMLASLRSLCKDWDSMHEVSWSWLWENVERMILALMGKPAAQRLALERLYGALDENALGVVRREVYSKFFALAPAGQDFFKQSTTRLHFIADKLLTMTLDMYKDPQRMVEDISALGLRHVGYGIPTDLFGPFVTACVQVIRMLTDDDAAEESFRWSLSLVSRILVRVINEGSTIVMKAINANSHRQLKKAVGCAPRGQRALWMLNVQVGTQSISPLMWAIETGSLEAASAIFQDLLTIRADRDRYYYGMDILFERHPDIIKRLCLDAPGLLPVLFDGLIWRSRVTENGRRRVNYYIKPLVVDQNGAFSQAIEWLTDNQDPGIVCHSAIAMVTDMIWGRVAFKTFLYGRTWFLFTLMVFLICQAVLNKTDAGSTDPLEMRIAVFLCRAFIYVFSMGQMIFHHTRCIVKDCREGKIKKVGIFRVPEYLSAWQEKCSLLLVICLAVMLALEPTLHCMGGDVLFTRKCPAGLDRIRSYSVMSMIAILLYFLLLSDLSVFSTRISAFALVCGRMVSEVLLFLCGLTFFAVSFTCAVTALKNDNDDFATLPKTFMQLWRITFGMMSGERWDSLRGYPALTTAVLIYVITSNIFLLNLLISQLSCAYQLSFRDMAGFARLNRGKIVYETMPHVPKWRWTRFLEALALDQRIEFGEGDIGLAGGIQVWELGSANITIVDLIKRYGGSTSPEAQWPEEDQSGGDEADRFERMERHIEKAIKRAGGSKKGGSASGSLGSAGRSGSGSGSVGGSADGSE